MSNLASGTIEQSTILLSHKLLPAIKPWLLNKNSSPEILRATTHCVSNLCADGEIFIQAIFDSDLFPTLINMMKEKQIKHDDSTYREYSIYAICWVLKLGNEQQIIQLITWNVLEQLAKLLHNADQEDKCIVVMLLQGIQRLYTELTPEISTFNTMNQDLLWDSLKLSGIWNYVKLLQNSKNKKHRKAALSIVLAEPYWNCKNK